MFLHCVPKSAAPCSNRPNSVFSSWISTKYRALHYLNITYGLPIMTYALYRVCSV